VLFYRGNILVDAVFEKLSAMSGRRVARSVRSAAFAYRQHTKSAHPAAVPSEIGLCEEHREIRAGSGGSGEDKRSALRAPGGLSASAEVAMGNYQTADGIAALI